jgi:hypothetical protein
MVLGKGLKVGGSYIVITWTYKDYQLRGAKPQFLLFPESWGLVDCVQSPLMWSRLCLGKCRVFLQ